MDENNKQQDQKDLIKSIFHFFREHPAVLMSLLYLQISAVGVVYMWSLFRKFEINIMDFSETNDFLLAAFKEPVAFFQSFFTITFFIIFIAYYKKRFKRIINRSKKGASRADKFIFAYSNIVIIIATILYTVLPAYFFGLRDADKIKKGDALKVVVHYKSISDSAIPNKLENGIFLIGTSEKFVFFYNRKKDCFHVIPIANILNIYNLPKYSNKDAKTRDNTPDKSNNNKNNPSKNETPLIKN